MPAGIAVDSFNKRIFVADPFRRRLQIYVKDVDYIEPQLNL